MPIVSKRSSRPSALTQLKIKTNAVNRLVKDKQVYVDEIEAQKVRIEEFRMRNAHEADIRKQNEVLEETVLMIPHMERRIRDAAQDLENLVLASAAEIDDLDVLDDARKALAATRASDDESAAEDKAA
ncbi:hypothetical protein H4R26_002922 [Coemansia thaxteri]|uniref:Tubulin-specific chaperone A n=1 Tax=Coemansia thaxteri TaxID=2663907 RepID=A0A9W8EJP2_9FUNG|nr:hypothetical protein H4R26_002922 [Coemansia thaxteri]KAJ2484495.1 hypothetical protein EV174_002386 [Coemansia sp. RSA 2320]